MRPIIEIKGLSKKYRIRHEHKYLALRDEISDSFKRIFTSTTKKEQLFQKKEDFWALKDISFDVNRGEVIGVIGRNGAGKSTLLKLISRITYPTEGQISLRGRVASLLEVGTGFHPELTGRENIYFNGSILGMKKSEINKKFNEIVAFSEVEKFLDTPIKHYSSGMRTRLAFAVAAHLEPEILLIDEVLAVGDAAFQEKCLGRMRDVAEGGRTVLFVSHNMSAILNLCPKVYLLDNGRILMSGESREVVEKYLERVHKSSDYSLANRFDRRGDGKLRFVDVEIKDEKGIDIDVIMSGKDMIFSVSYKAAEEKPLKNVQVAIGVSNSMGQFLFLCMNEMAGTPFKELPWQGCVTCRIPKLPLSPGQYYFNIYCEVNGVIADWVIQAGRFIVSEGDFFGTGKLPPPSHAGFLMQQNWSFKEKR